MSTTENSKQIVRNFYEGFSTHDLPGVFEEYISDNLVNHAMDGSFDKYKWLGYEQAALAAVPDLKVTVLDQVAEGNKVMTQWTYEGTHTGNFFDKPATGNTIRLEAMSVDIVEDGKIVEHTSIADFTQFMQQFGK